MMGDDLDTGMGLDDTVPPFPRPSDEWRVTVTSAGIGYDVTVREVRGLEYRGQTLTRRGAERKAARLIKRTRRERARPGSTYTVRPEDQP